MRLLEGAELAYPASIVDLDLVPGLDVVLLGVPVFYRFRFSPDSAETTWASTLSPFPPRSRSSSIRLAVAEHPESRASFSYQRRTTFFIRGSGSMQTDRSSLSSARNPSPLFATHPPAPLSSKEQRRIRVQRRVPLILSPDACPCSWW